MYLSRRIILRIVLTSSLVLLPACRRPTPVTVSAAPLPQERSTDLLTLSVRMSDVSLPLGVRPQDRSKSQDDPVVIASFEARFPHEVVADFYTLDMERLGWRRVMDFTTYDKEILLIFEKPHKICAVRIIANTGTTCTVTCYVSSKKNDTGPLS